MDSLFWTALHQQSKPLMTDIPVSKAQLHGRATEFDDGGTGAWMAGLQRPTWRAVRDAHTGHTIHCVSDRPFEALTRDLRTGLRLLAWISQKTPVTWYWWDHAWPRRLPADTLPGKIHLNGGWARPGIPEIHIYRREEVHKVMIHESIHALGLDVPHHLVAGPLASFEAALGRRLWPHLGEAFTELYAEWLWAIADAQTLAAAKRNWSAQLACSETQAGAVWARTRGSSVAEDTNVFAYYILKWVLMQHLMEVLLAPAASVRHWFGWWVAAGQRLDQLASEAAGSLSMELAMGMTCK
jgi:hypothetical protein